MVFQMRIVKIPKGRGKFRTIYVPSHPEKLALRGLVHQIMERVEKICPDGVVHGFARQKSAVTMAQAHVGHAYTLCFDLRNFFDSITISHLKGKLPQDLIEKVLVDGAPRQGLPTSPAVANIAASDMDKAILRWGEKRQIIYTRYADDLAISYDNPALTAEILAIIPQIVGRCGFKLAKEKTRLLDAKSGRRIICGVAVDSLGIHPTRSVKRKLRAAKHQNNTYRANGLEEWAKLKPPKRRSFSLIGSADKIEQIQKLAKFWRLGNVYAKDMPDKGEDIKIDADCIITGDPIYMLGMSTWTNGWRSCTRQPDGQYRRGTVFFSHLRGTRIAALLDDKTQTIAGITRKNMLARALVHQLRDEKGTLVYDRVYGTPENIEKLVAKLKGYGIINISSAKQSHKNIKVVGHAPATWRAWFDNLSHSAAKASSGRWSGKQVRICHI